MWAERRNVTRWAAEAAVEVHARWAAEAGEWRAVEARTLWAAKAGERRRAAYDMRKTGIKQHFYDSVSIKLTPLYRRQMYKLISCSLVYYASSHLYKLYKSFVTVSALLMNSII